jgi:hypothetical protein
MRSDRQPDDLLLHQIMIVKMAIPSNVKQKLGMNPVHRGMTTIRTGKSQEPMPQPGGSTTLLEIFPRRGVIRFSDSGSEHPGGARGDCRVIRDHRMPGHNPFSSSRLCRISSRTRFCSALPSEEYSPCFQRERRDLAKPSGVRGPVLAPPCIRHRPLRIAGA